MVDTLLRVTVTGMTPNTLSGALLAVDRAKCGTGRRATWGSVARYDGEIAEMVEPVSNIVRVWTPLTRGWMYRSLWDGFGGVVRATRPSTRAPPKSLNDRVGSDNRERDDLCHHRCSTIMGTREGTGGRDGCGYVV